MYLIKFSFILFISNILQYLYSIADIIFISHFENDNAVAALGNCASLMFVITSISVGLSIGGAVVISKYKGSKDYTKYKQSIGSLLFLSIHSLRPLTILPIKSPTSSKVSSIGVKATAAFALKSSMLSLNFSL